MNGKEKLQQELTNIVIMPIQRIAQFLIEECDKDEALLQAAEAGNKTLEKCYQFIRAEAKKHAVDGAACIDETTVFRWAKEYYLKKEEPKPKAEAAPKTAEKSKAGSKKNTAKSDKKSEDPQEKPAEVIANEDPDEDWLD